MIRLKILGPVELSDSEGNLAHSFLSGAKRLALLAYLLLNQRQGFQRRDQILTVFWPDMGEKNARNALSNMLYHIRQNIDENLIITRGRNEIRIDKDKIWCDAVEFLNLIDNLEMNDAIRLYRGEFLEGLHFSQSSAEFDNWIERTRGNFKNKYNQALQKLAEEAEETKNFTKAAKLWRMYVLNDPYNTGIVRRLVESLAASGNKAAALHQAKSHVLLLQKELGVNPDNLMDELTSGLNEISPTVKNHENKQASPKDFSQKSKIDEHTLAVIPFADYFNEQKQSPFIIGFHNDLLTKLSTIKDLTVISSDSVQRYKDADTPFTEIAKELGAGAVIKGIVQQVKNKIRLSVQLIDTVNERVQWAETYDRLFSIENLFDLQSELAEKISLSLQAKLNPFEKNRMLAKPAKNLEAFNLYSQGRSFMNQRTEHGMNKAITSFQKAIHIDSGYSQAWAGLAEALVLGDWYNFSVPEKYDQKEILYVAEKAISLNPNLGEPYSSLGIFYASQQNGPLSVRNFRKAIELQPSYAEAFTWLGWMEMMLGNPLKAIDPAERAVKLDPLSTYTHVFLGEIYLANRFYEEAFKEAAKARRLQPEYGIAHFVEGISFYHLKKYSEAQISFKQALELTEADGSLSHHDIQSMLAVTLTSVNKQNESRLILNQMQNQQKFCAAGLIHASLGEFKQSIKSFKKERNWGAFSTPMIRYFYPELLKPIRESEEYQKIIQNVNRCWGIS